jgi:glycosyltransferase involved in cell wall biosynthesis
MTHVHIRGPLLSISGYGVHARQIARWAFLQDFKITAEILPWGNTPWYTDRDECNGLIDKIMEASTPLQSKPDYSFQVQLPHEWNNTLAKKNFGVSAIVETDRCSTKWIESCLKMNHVIVPSEFSKRCLVNSGLKSKRVTVIPESYIDSCAEIPDELPIEFETDKNFLMLGQMSGDWETDRKNTAQTIALFCDTFKGRDDIGLIVKTNSGSNSCIDRTISRNKLKSILQQVRKSEFPKVYFLHGYLKDKEVSSLYHHPKVKGLISLTHGEGFGLPLLEAAACGLPVLATNWSAHTEFLNLGSWSKVHGRIEPVPQSKIDDIIFVKDANWANPDVASASHALKNFVENNEDLWDDAKALQQKIRNSYSFKKISYRYDKFFKRWK